jgi:hypothetical protein
MQSISNAQNPQLDEALKNRTYSADWVFYQQTKHVDIFYQYTSCGGNLDCCEFVFLKFQNKSGQELSITSDLILDRNSSLNNEDSRRDIQKLNIKLLPGQIIKNDCNSTNNNISLIIVRELKNPQINFLSKIEITNLHEISPIK